MRTSTLLARNLRWYWRTNLAVLLGVAAATGVLGGALLVGHSVRASLRHLALARLGNVDYVVARPGFLREQLAESIPRSAPLIATEAAVAHESSGRRAAGVSVYGVDERFWKFQGEPNDPPRGREIYLTAALARELRAAAGDTVLLRVPKPSAIPLESLHGPKDDAAKTVRLTVARVDAREFSLRPQQGDVRAAWVPLQRLQRELNQPDKVNTIAAAGTPTLGRYTLADLGLSLRTLENPAGLSLESDSALISEPLAAAAQSLGFRTQPVLTYLVNAIRAGSREIPYSLVTALDSAPAPAAADEIVLNEWAARELGAKSGDPLELTYYTWQSDGRLHTATASFRVAAIVPIPGAAAGRDWTPQYPGITASRSLRDWDPPFPLDLARIRPADEQYWDRYRTTPKAFIRLSRGRALWGTRFGSLTSIRVPASPDAFGPALLAALDPAQMGLAALPVRAQSIAAAGGSTDFGEYFVYFSFFLMVSALLLTGLFFRLGVEQRSREIGVLRALGFPAARIRSLFLLEGLVLALAGAAAGIAAALGYGALILLGLRTWWVDAVGTHLLSLHASAPALAAGALAGVVAGLAAVAFALRDLAPLTPRGLLAGSRKPARTRWRIAAALVSALAAAALVAAALAARLDPAAAFFGAGALALVSALLFQSAWLHTRAIAGIHGQITLGMRSAAWHPGRSILCIALIASAAFVIVSLDAFRRDGSSAATTGFPLLADSVLPLVHDPDTAAGRAALNLPPLEGVRIVSFRVRPGDDASCLNLYRPTNPRIVAAPAGFTLGPDPAPWRLLASRPADGAVPAIADANSLTYVLHLKIGDTFETAGLRFRIVAALHDSVFQSELIISEADFLRLFPTVEGYRFFLLAVPPGKDDEVARVLEDSLSDYGFDVQPAAARLAQFHRVENTYLATFRALGGLGLVLGTVGLAAVLMRNVLERRREFALLRAVGYRPLHLSIMVLAENVFLLATGLVTGALAAAIAVAPAISAHGGRLPFASLALLLAVVLATGVVASLAATAAALRAPLLEALRSE